MNLKKLSSLLTGVGGALVTTGAIYSCIYSVDPGERAIIFSKFYGGIQKRVYGPGFHFYIPFMQEIIKYDIKIQPYDHLTESGTKDLQKVTLKIRLFYRPLEDAIPKIHLELNRDYMKKVLPSLANEVSKSIIAKYDAETLLKSREAVAIEIKHLLITRAKVFNIVLQDVSIHEL